MREIGTLVCWATSMDAEGKVSGNKETLRVSYERFMAMVEKSAAENGATQKLLSPDRRSLPKIEFQSRQNLKHVAGRKRLRRQLGKFLDSYFLQNGRERIAIYDDYEPYSFQFVEHTAYGRGLCGGIILHGQDHLKTAYYGMHT